MEAGECDNGAERVCSGRGVADVREPSHLADALSSSLVSSSLSATLIDTNAGSVAHIPREEGTRGANARGSEGRGCGVSLGSSLGVLGPRLDLAMDGHDTLQLSIVIDGIVGNTSSPH